jgi:hypothetical protein
MQEVSGSKPGNIKDAAKSLEDQWEAIRSRLN